MGSQKINFTSKKVEVTRINFAFLKRSTLKLEDS